MDAYTICDSMGNTAAYLCAGRAIGSSWAVGTARDPAPTTTKSNAEWSITGAGTTAVNGTYALIDDTTENNEIWSNGTYKLSKWYNNIIGEATTYYIYPISGGLLPSAANHTYYGYKSGGNYKPNEVVWSVGKGSMAGIAPVPTFTEYTEGGDDSGGDSETMDLLVTFYDSTYELNGIYRNNGTLNGYPSYKHESKEYYIFADIDGRYYLDNDTTTPEACYYYGPQGSAIGTYQLGVFGGGGVGTATYVSN
jgi:hypothetical protein